MFDNARNSLTSCVCAFCAAGLRRGLQGSFAGIGGIGLHVRLLIVMMRIGENPVLLHCPTGHHFYKEALDVSPMHDA